MSVNKERFYRGIPIDRFSKKELEDEVLYLKKKINEIIRRT